MSSAENLNLLKVRMRRRLTDRTARAIDVGLGSLRVSRQLLFVSGFWRSGTTWFQELISRNLNAKTVFEPLSPMNPSRYKRLIALGYNEHHLREAYIPGKAGPDDPLWLDLDGYFRGTLSSRSSIRARESVWQSFRRDIVLKDVRLQANLASIHERYDVPVVHIRRHPCAVVHSFARSKWDWTFENIRLVDIISPLMEDLSATGDCSVLFTPEFDVDGTSRIAAYWAATERIAEHLIGNREWGKIIPYGQIVESKHDVIAETCALVGRAPNLSNDVEFDSITTVSTSWGVDSGRRAVSWREGLSSTDIARIIEIAGAVFPNVADGLKARLKSSAQEAYGFAA